MLSSPLPKQPVTFPCHTCVTEHFLPNILVSRSAGMTSALSHFALFVLEMLSPTCNSSSGRPWCVTGGYHQQPPTCGTKRLHFYVAELTKQQQEFGTFFFFFFPHPRQHKLTTKRRPPPKQKKKKKEVRNILYKHTETTHSLAFFSPR